MRKVYFLLFLLLMGTIVSAQRKETIHQRQLVIPPTHNVRLQSKGETTFNESGLIPVKKGDSIFIQPDVIYPAKKHNMLRGVIKTLGLGALAYQANKTLHPFQGTTDKGNVNQQGNKSFIPALGVGLALSYPEFAGKHSKSKPYLKYLLYGKDSTLISQKIVQLNKKTRHPITGKVEKDGYLKVLLADNSESNTVSNDLALNIQSVEANSFSVTKLISADTTAQNVSDSTVLNSDTTVAVSKLAAIRAFDEDDGEEDGGGGDGGGDGGDGGDGYNGDSGDGYDASSGYDASGYDASGYDASGYDENGYDVDGYDVDGEASDYDVNGYDENGYDENGYDENGLDENGYDVDGYDENGYDENGYDVYGYDENGLDVNGQQSNDPNSPDYILPPVTVVGVRTKSGDVGCPTCYLLAPVTVIGTIPSNGGGGPGTNPTPTTLTYNNKDCMHGGQNSNTNNQAVYQVSSGNSSVIQGFSTTVSIDNDGDPNCNKQIDKSYQNTTSYNTGLSGQADYLDGTKVAYIALNVRYFKANGMTVRIGDVVALTNSSTGQTIFAVVGDGGNKQEFGEMSYKAAHDLFPDATKKSLSSSDLVNITIFNNSSPLKGNINQQDVINKGKALLANNPQLSLNAPPAGVSAKC
jgi:hypothetical protein